MEGDTFAVTGATGLVGRQLVKLLIGRGDKVNVLTRDPARARETLGSFSQLGFYGKDEWMQGCLLYTSPSPRDLSTSRMPSSA